MVSYLPLPRRGALSGKSARTCRRWRLFLVRAHQPQRPGLTTGRVPIHVDTGVHPDLLSSRFSNVAVSRASHEATIFTDDVNRLAQHLGTEVSKASALDVAQKASVTHDQAGNRDRFVSDCKQVQRQGNER